MNKEKIIRGYIYKITNLVNGKVYIGKTTYKDIKKRFTQHEYYALVRHGGSSTTIHQAIRDFGIENFKINLECIVYAPKYLEDVEKEYIKSYHSWIRDPECNGYNQSQGGEGTHYKDNEFNEVLLERIVSTYKEVKNQEETARLLKINVTTVHNYLIMNGIDRDDAKTIAIRETGKKVAIIQNDKIIAIYPSLGEAARHFEEKEQASHISEVCYGKRKHVKGYTAQFTDKEIFNENYMLPTVEPTIQKEKPYRPNSIKCKMIDPKTNEIIKVFDSMAEAGRYLNVPIIKNISSRIRKSIEKNQLCCGYKWEIII